MRKERMRLVAIKTPSRYKRRFAVACFGKNIKARNRHEHEHCIDCWTMKRNEAVILCEDCSIFKVSGQLITITEVMTSDPRMIEALRSRIPVMLSSEKYAARRRTLIEYARKARKARRKISMNSEAFSIHMELVASSAIHMAK